MHGHRRFRVGLLALSMLSGCAASSVGAPRGGLAASGPFGAYLIGRFAQDNNDPALAARNLLAALGPAANDPALLNQAFMACLLADRPEAVDLARRLPGNPLAQLLLGDTEARAGRWQAAAAQYAALPQQGLTQLLAPLLIAWAQSGHADVDGALATLTPRLQTPPLSGLFALHAALIADLGNRYPQAQALYAQARANYGGTTLRLSRIEANWEQRQGHADDAAATLQALGVNAPALAIVVPRLIADVGTRPVRGATDGLAEVYLSFAAELRQQAGGDTALALLHLALNLRPDLAAARMLEADALDVDKHPLAALRALAPIGNADPLAPLVRLRRAQLEAELGDNDIAAAGLRELATALPDRPEPLAALADLQRGAHRSAEAIGTYGAAIARVPANAPSGWPLFFARAVAEQQSGKWPEAEADLRHALYLAPDQPEILNFLGYSWADRDEHLPEARGMLARAVTLRPNDGAIIDSLGWVMLRQGDVDGAVKSLERAVQMEPTDAEINGHLGDAYWAAGRKLQARYQWQLALDLKPDPAVVPKLRAKLQDAEREGAVAR